MCQGAVRINHGRIHGSPHESFISGLLQYPLRQNTLTKQNSDKIYSSESQKYNLVFTLNLINIHEILLFAFSSLLMDGLIELPDDDYDTEHDKRERQVKLIIYQI